MDPEEFCLTPGGGTPQNGSWRCPAQRVIMLELVQGEGNLSPLIAVCEP